MEKRYNKAMKKNRSRLWIVLALAALMSGLSGCLAVVAAGAAAGGVAYAKGDLEADVAATPPQAVEATRNALTQMGLAQIYAAATSLDGKVTARTANDRSVTVKVTGQGKQTSRLSIRVGVFGDEPLSREIYDKIKANL